MVALLLVATAVARAGESQAERLFQQARDLMLDDRFAEACPLLEESQRLEPRVGTLLNLAVCHERVGRIGTSWIELQHALVAAREEGRDDRVTFAQARIEVLTPRVPWLTVSVPSSVLVEGIQITLNGVEIERDSWGKEMAVDPGPVVVRATSPGHHPFEERLTFREGEHKSVVLTALIAEVGATPKAVAAKPVPPAKPPAARVEPAPEESRWVIEFGLFGGYLQASTDRAEPVIDEGTIELMDPSGNRTSCAAATCDHHLPTTGGAAIGINAFAGYEATERLHLGGRLLVGPRIGGGSVFATGPSAQLLVAGPFWIGASALLGFASLTDTGTTEPGASYSLTVGGPFEMDASTDLAIGPALELHLFLIDTPQGSFEIHSIPLLLLGQNGNAWMVPLGAAYRFH